MLECLGPAHAPMPRPSLHSALGTALLLISPLAMALGFGPTRNHTTLGQTLNFAASVTLDAEESVQRDCVAAQVTAGDNPVSTRHVRAVLEATRDPGQRIVRVTTSIAMDEPIVTIDVSIGCGSRVSRRYLAFIDPPSLHLVEAVAPSETVPLPSSRNDSQAAALADIARQADASQGRGGRTALAHDREWAPPRTVRTAYRAPAAVTVANATPVQEPKPRKQTAATRRNEAKTRTALVAAPRTGGARLRLDPPRIVAARQAPPAPARSAAPTALFVAPAALAMAAVPVSAPPPSAWDE